MALWKHVIQRFCSYHAQADNCALILIAEPEDFGAPIQQLKEYIASVNQNHASISIVHKLTHAHRNEKCFFPQADAWLANRDKRTIMRSEYADEYHVEILSAVDTGK